MGDRRTSGHWSAAATTRSPDQAGMRGLLLIRQQNRGTFPVWIQLHSSYRRKPVLFKVFHRGSVNPPASAGSLFLFLLPLREKVRMRGSAAKRRSRASPLTLSLSHEGRGDQQAAGWPTDPAFSRNRKPPTLVGGAFIGRINMAVGRIAARRPIDLTSSRLACAPIQAEWCGPASVREWNVPDSACCRCR